MAIDERRRHELYLRAEDVLGPDEANTLMELLPPVGWGDVATKRDLDALAVATKRDLDALAVATKRDLDALAVATKRDIEALGDVATKQDLEMGLANLGNIIRAEMHSLARQSVFALVAIFVTLAGFMAGMAFALGR